MRTFLTVDYLDQRHAPEKIEIKDMAIVPSISANGALGPVYGIDGTWYLWPLRALRRARVVREPDAAPIA